MDGKWGMCGVAALLLGTILGCRTPAPDLKPVETPEVLNKPPQEARFSNPAYPKEAFHRDDPAKRWKDMLLNDTAVMPARGSFGGPSGGMMR
ncbi:MAG: hypothetical protein L0Y71_01485 [Gemmataceae bacterium]|nr:hypothetical protein [Gemmataceae bacterium]